MFLRIFLLSSLALYTVCESKNHVIILNEDNWQDMTQGEWMVEFYAPWCPACKALQPLWNDFATWGEDLGIKVGQVDVTWSPGLSGRFMVTALPTIYHVKDGEFRQYRGSRDKDEFISFVEEKKWKEIEPIPSWKSPSSVQMSLVSCFFRLSMHLRNIHTHLTEDYGLPYWGSYVIFAAATIIVGAILGLILVFVIDCIYPPKIGSPRKSVPEASAKDRSDAEDEDHDELVDEQSSQAAESSGMEDDEGHHSQSDKEAEEATSAKMDSGSEAKTSPDVRKRRARKAD